MAIMADLITRVRRDLGDLGTPFKISFLGDGQTNFYELPSQNVDPSSISAMTIYGNDITDLLLGTDFALDVINGVVTTTVPPLPEYTLLISGTNFGLFSDDDLTGYVTDAFNMHTSGRTLQSRYQDASGFIRYTDDPITIGTLPPLEDPLIALLATIECLWTLATDSSLNVDIQTAEGTFVPRSQRYRQILQQIDMLTSKYQLLCAQLNVGLFRIEVTDLRRVSYTTGRLVPIFKEREYDDYSLPLRLLPPIDGRNEDESGIPSQSIGGWWRVGKADFHQGRFTRDYETDAMNLGLRGWQHTTGQTIQYYSFVEQDSFMEDIYDEGAGVGKVFRGPFTVPVIRVTHIEGPNQNTDSGFYYNDTLAATCSFDQLAKLGFTQQDLHHDWYMRDRIEYDGIIFAITAMSVLGQIVTRDIIISIEATQVRNDELVNDPQFREYTHPAKRPYYGS